MEPAQAAVGIERVLGPAGVAGVEHAARPHRDVALPPVDELTGRRLAGRLVAPQHVAVAGAQAVEVLVARAERDRAAAAEDAGRVDDLAGLEAPLQAAAVDGVEP